MTARKKPAPKKKAPPAKKVTPKKAAASAKKRVSRTKVEGSIPSAGTTLTKRVAKFVEEYVKDFNGRQAAIRAGYSPNGAEVTASRLLRNPNVRAVLAPDLTKRVEERAEAINRMELSVERTRLEIARLAYFDPRKMFDKSGNPIPLHELDDDTAACINGLDVLEEYEGSGDDRRLIGHVKKYKVADKNSALEKASKILGLFEQDNKQKAVSLSEAVSQFVQQLHGSQAGKLPMVQRQAPAKPGPDAKGHEWK